MKTNYIRFWREITSIISLAGISLLITVPSQAREILNPRPSIFNQPPYNRGKRPSQIPPIKTPTPTDTQVPTVPTVPNATETKPSDTQVPTVPNVTETKPSDTQAPTVPTVPSAIETTPTPTTSETQETRNLIVLANSQGSFTTLIKALAAAGLIDKLQGPGPFTIFAPTDTAFKNIKKDDLEDLLKPENKEILLKVLTYHVVPGKILSKDLKAGGLTSMHGDPIDVKINNNVIEVNDAKVIQPDIQGSNGVIHVIDNFIIPPSL